MTCFNGVMEMQEVLGRAEAKRNLIFEMKRRGFSFQEIADELNVSRQRIAQIYRKAKGTQQSRRRKP